MNSRDHLDIIMFIMNIFSLFAGAYMVFMAPKAIRESPKVPDERKEKQIRLIRICGVLVLLCSLFIVVGTLVVDFAVFE